MCVCVLDSYAAVSKLQIESPLHTYTHADVLACQCPLLLTLHNFVCSFKLPSVVALGFIYSVRSVKKGCIGFMQCPSVSKEIRLHARICHIR